MLIGLNENYEMKLRPFILCWLSLISVSRAADQAELIRLYEEEILAHDLYVALAKNNAEVMPLKNIPQSELRHKQVMAGILKIEGIDEPRAANGRRFVTKGLDEIYEKWFAEGMKSALDACRVGVRLEDHDIAELRKAQIDFPNHKQVLSQLELASNNHLRAFHRNLVARGGSYKVEALTDSDFKLILDGSGKAGGDCGKRCHPPTKLLEKRASEKAQLDQTSKKKSPK